MSLIHSPKLLIQYQEPGYQIKSLDLCGTDKSRGQITVKVEKYMKTSIYSLWKGLLLGSFAFKGSSSCFVTVLDLFLSSLPAQTVASILASFGASLCNKVKPEDVCLLISGQF